MSDSLVIRQLLTKKSKSIKKFGSDSLFFTSESLFSSQKTSESLEKPMSEFSTLHFCVEIIMTYMMGVQNLKFYGEYEDPL